MKIDKGIAMKGRNGYFPLAEVDIIVSGVNAGIGFSSKRRGQGFGNVVIEGSFKDVTDLLDAIKSELYIQKQRGMV